MEREPHLWLIPVHLPGRYFSAQLAVRANTAEYASALADGHVATLNGYAPGLGLVAGEPVPYDEGATNDV